MVRPRTPCFVSSIAENARAGMCRRYCQSQCQFNALNLLVSKGYRLTTRRMVEPTGFEPVTSSMPSMRAPNCATAPRYYLTYNTRTGDGQTPRPEQFPRAPLYH